jgi:hypothetical protein
MTTTTKYPSSGARLVSFLVLVVALVFVGVPRNAAASAADGQHQHHYSAAALRDRVDPAALPGISPEDGRPLDFPLFAGYVRVDPDGGGDEEEEQEQQQQQQQQHGAADKGRALFYALAEPANGAAPRALVMFANGGPGCSSIGGGLLSELGPFFPRRLPPPARSSSRGGPDSPQHQQQQQDPPSSFALDPNPYAWNRDPKVNASVLFVESPAFVGFSYSNDSRDSRVGDVRTALDAATFLRRLVQRFPRYATLPLYLSGESYAGHYVPTLAAEILRVNKVVMAEEAELSAAGGAVGANDAAADADDSAAQSATDGTFVAAPKLALNLRGFFVGNPWTDALTDNGGALDYWYSHAMISDEARREVRGACDLSRAGPLMLRARQRQLRRRAAAAMAAAPARVAGAAVAAGPEEQSQLLLRSKPEAMLFRTAEDQEEEEDEQKGGVNSDSSSNSGNDDDDGGGGDSSACDAALDRAAKESGDINIYNIYKPVCHEPRQQQQQQPNGQEEEEEGERHLGGGGVGGRRLRLLGQSAALLRQGGADRHRARRGRRYDPCIGDVVEAYLNDPGVQSALHADPTLGALPGGSRAGDASGLPPPAGASPGWADCTRRVLYSREDLLSSMLPLYRRLLPQGAARWGEREQEEEERWVEGVAAAAGGAAGGGGEAGRRRDAAVRRAWLHAAASFSSSSSSSAAASRSSSSPPRPPQQLRLWVYSGDVDGIVPVLGTRRWVEGLGLQVARAAAAARGDGGEEGEGEEGDDGSSASGGAWRSWTDAEGQVGGRRVDYQGGLSLVTVRGAGHMVPYDAPQRARELMRMFFAAEEEGAAAGDEAASWREV